MAGIICIKRAQKKLVAKTVTILGAVFFFMPCLRDDFLEDNADCFTPSGRLSRSIVDMMDGSARMKILICEYDEVS